jgi:hypothetical protein
MGDIVGKLCSHTSSNPSQTRGWPKAPSAIHGPLRSTLYSTDKANLTLDCLVNQLTMHDLCDCAHRRHAKATVEAQLATVYEDASGNFQPSDVSK